ncbi:MAG: phage scaffolding protein [Chloroflexi bacterium]|nr:phage scaffolding protein [Chloroflexota bacterium]
MANIEYLTINGRMYWRLGGTVLPIIAGGAEPGGGEGNQGQNTGDGGQGQQQQQQGQGAGKTFTQEELDRVINERLARERDKYKDYEDLKKAKAKLDELDTANKSELEKAQETARKAEEQRTAALATANERLIKAEVKLKAVALNIVDADAAFALMDRAAVKVNDQGEVEGVEAALKALVKAKAYLVASTGGGSSATNGQRQQGQDGQETPEQRRARVYGSSGGVLFDPAVMRERGGGVYFPGST